MKGESWKFKLMTDICAAMNRSGSKQDFIVEMERCGYCGKEEFIAYCVETGHLQPIDLMLYAYIVQCVVDFRRFDIISTRYPS